MTENFYTHIQRSNLRQTTVQLIVQLLTTLTKLCHIKRDHPEIFFYISQWIYHKLLLKCPCPANNWRQCYGTYSTVWRPDDNVGPRHDRRRLSRRRL